MLAAQSLRLNAARLPDKTALVAGARRVTFARLDAMVDRLAAALVAEGIAAGDRVIVLLDDGLEAATALLAVLRAGAVIVPVTPATDTGGLAFILDDCRVAGLVTESRLAAAAAAAMAEASTVPIVVLAGGDPPPLHSGCLSFEDVVARPLAAPATDPSRYAEDAAVILYASDAGYFPHGLVLTHGDVAAAVDGMTRGLASGEGDVALVAAPIASEQGLCQVLSAVATGATLIIEKPSAAPRTILRRIGTEKATGVSLLPAMVPAILQTGAAAAGGFPHLRYVHSAAPLAPADLEGLRWLWPETRVVEERFAAGPTIPRRAPDPALRPAAAGAPPHAGALPEGLPLPAE